MKAVIWNIYTPFSSQGTLEEQTLVNTSSGSIVIQAWTNALVYERRNNLQIFTAGRSECQSRSLVIAIFADGIYTQKTEP